MKITIERVTGSLSAPSTAHRYFVVIDQPGTHAAPFVPSIHNESWQTTLANAITYIQGVTEVGGK
jgi:hypothetical protein